MALSNSQFDAIMRVYNQRQFLNKRRQDERIREVYERIPQVEALTDEIAAAMAQAARRKLLGDEDGARAFKEEASLLKEQKRKYLQRAGYPDDYMDCLLYTSGSEACSLPSASWNRKARWQDGTPGPGIWTGFLAGEK